MTGGYGTDADRRSLTTANSFLADLFDEAGDEPAPLVLVSDAQKILPLIPEEFLCRVVGIGEESLYDPVVCVNRCHGSSGASLPRWLANQTGIRERKDDRDRVGVGSRVRIPNGAHPVLIDGVDEQPIRIHGSGCVGRPENARDERSAALRTLNPEIFLGIAVVFPGKLHGGSSDTRAGQARRGIEIRLDVGRSVVFAAAPEERRSEQGTEKCTSFHCINPEMRWPMFVQNLYPPSIEK